MDGEPKAALFATADAFVMPARRVGNSVESFGIVYIEAGWYGLPSIAGRDGGAGDAVLDGRTGLLCDPFTQTDVTQQILRLLDDAALRKRLGAAAAERARGELQWKAGLQRYLDALGVSGAAGKRA
jgi:phosphatidylinositol alpha-1,6-mannosyltransferase